MDPRRTASAQWADDWLGLNVGTDIALSNAMAREIIHAGWPTRPSSGAPPPASRPIARRVEPYTLEYAERETGVPGRR